MPRSDYEQQYERTGRPRAGDFCDPETGEFTEKGYELVRRGAGLGLSRMGIARLMGMSPRTFGDRVKLFPQIEEAIEEGKAAADLQVSNALFQKAKNGDMAAIRWYEMTRSGRNPNVPVVEVEAKPFAVEGPAIQSEQDWEINHSPAAMIEHDGDSAPIESSSG